VEQGSGLKRRRSLFGSSEVNLPIPNQAIDIVENLLQSYVLKNAAKNLKANTLSRSADV